MTDNSVKITGMIVGGIIVLALIGLWIANMNAPTSNTVQVQGMADIKAVPDLVTVYFNVQTNGTTAQEAKDKNSEIVDKAVNSIMSLGFSRADIITENFNVNPNTYWDGNRQVTDGYVANHNIKVEMSTNQSDKIGGVIDAGVNAGALINYINFELTQASQNKYKAEALKQATEDARMKAEAMASGLGKSVGKLVSVSSNDFGYYPWPVYQNARMDASGALEAKMAATTIQPGQQDITASVSVVYQIK